MNNDNKKIPMGWIIGLVFFILAAAGSEAWWFFVVAIMAAPIALVIWLYKKGTEQGNAKRNTTTTPNFTSSYNSGQMSSPRPSTTTTPNFTSSYRPGQTSSTVQSTQNTQPQPANTARLTAEQYDVAVAALQKHRDDSQSGNAAYMTPAQYNDAMSVLKKHRDQPQPITTKPQQRTTNPQQMRSGQQPLLPYGARPSAPAPDAHLCDDGQHNGSERAYKETLNDLEDGYVNYSGIPERVSLFLTPEQFNKKHNELKALLKAGVIDDIEYGEKLREYQDNMRR